MKGKSIADADETQELFKEIDADYKAAVSMFAKLSARYGDDHARQIWDQAVMRPRGKRESVLTKRIVAAMEMLKNCGISYVAAAKYLASSTYWLGQRDHKSGKYTSYQFPEECEDPAGAILDRYKDAKRRRKKSSSSD